MSVSVVIFCAWIQKDIMIDRKKKRVKKKKIVVLSSHTPSLFWFRMEMMSEFRKRGYQVIALADGDEKLWRERFRDRGIQYRSISVKRNGMNPFYDIGTFFSIFLWLRRIRPEKIFVYQAKTIIYGCIAARCLGIREIYPMISGIGSLFLSDSTKINFVRKLMMMGYKVSLNNAKTIFFQNNDDYSLFFEKKLINRSQSFRMIPGSGVNLRRFSVRRLPQKVVFICISRLIRDKGIFEYLEACKKIKVEYPDIRCLLVGPFDSNPFSLQMPQLRPYIEQEVIGYYGECEDVRPYLWQSSVFVLPSYREGTPKVILEAMACGRAVITTDAPGCRETVVDGENGYLVPVKDVNAIVKKMEIFCEHPELIEKMGKNGRLFAEEKFDVDIVDRIICETMRL